MAATAEIIDIIGPKEASPGDVVNVKVSVRNNGENHEYFGVSGSYLDGTLQRYASTTPSRARLSPGTQVGFIISFTMPNSDTEFIAQAWHGDTQNRMHDDSKRIVVKSVAISNQRRLISKLTGTVSSYSDFQTRQRTILRKFRQATNLRARTEAEARSSRQNSKEQVDDYLARTRKGASSDLKKAQKAMKDAQHALSTVGLNTLLEESKLARSPNSSAVEPAKASQRLPHFCTKAVQAGSRITGIVTEVKNWHEAERESSQLNKSLVLLLFSCFGFVFFLLGIIGEIDVALILLGLIPPPILLALADTVWDLDKDEPRKGGFSWVGLLWWLLAPVTPFVALYYIIVRYPASRRAINKRYAPLQPEHTAAPQIRALASDLVQALTQAELCYNSLVNQATQDHNRSLKQIEEDYNHKVTEARLGYEASWQRLSDESLGLHQTLGLIKAAWDDPLWNAWAPAKEGLLSPYVRIGQLTDQGGWHNLTMPALVPLVGKSNNIVIKCFGPAKDRAVEMVQGLMLRLLATIPPGKLCFTLIDPVGLGQSMAAFMNLADYDEALVGGKVWSKPQHIEEQLARLTEHMEVVIQKFLRDKYQTIEDYNTEAGEVAEPYRVLVVVDFPVNFSEAAAQHLVSVALKGPRCGVYIIITIDTEQKFPYGFREGGANKDPKEGFNLEDLERIATSIVWDGQRFIYQDDGFSPCRLELDRAPSSELLNRILESVGSQAKEASRVETPFERIAPRSTLWWQGSTADGLQAPVGRTGARKVQRLELGQGVAQHALVVGRTGAGKSTLLHTLITALALVYPPDELELYLVDFKKGVEFKTYAIHNLPHARVVAIESEREFGLSVLQGLNAEINRRGELFRNIGVDHISDYRTKSAKRLPRILLIVDEFQEFFVEDDSIASQASQILDRLVRQGRAFGIHVLLGSQTLAGAYTLAHSTIGQMAIRIALQCSEADSRLILAEDNPAARLLSRPGQAIYNAASGLVEGNNLFQVAWLPDEKHDTYLKGIQAMAQKRKYVSTQPQIIFEGNAPAKVQKNKLLYDLLSIMDWPAETRNAAVWLGEPIAIKEPTSACFRRQSGSNLLIVGQNDEAAAGMVLVSLVSLAAQYKPQDTRFYILNFSQVDAPYVELFAKVGDSLPHSVQIVERRKSAEVIGKTFTEVKKRLDTESAGEKRAIFLTVFGIQRARDLRQEDDFSYGTLDEERERSPSGQFDTILKEGPDVGIFTIAWCDSYTNLMRTLDRRTLREFEMRVIFQMNSEDSSNLIDSPLANKLGPYRSLYFSEEDGRLEKFRPYGLPTKEWLAWVAEQLQKRKSG